MMKLLTTFGGLIYQLINKKLNQKQLSEKETGNSICKESEIEDYAKLTFESLFEKKEKLQEIQSELVKNKMRHPVSGHWTDCAKGNKQTLVCILKKLNILCHFHSEIKMNCYEIQAVCQNSFGVKISISHISKIKWDDIILDFIT